MLKNLNSRGISHLIVPLVVMIVVAIGGIFFVVGGHAATPSKSKTSIHIKAFYASSCSKDSYGHEYCKLKKSHATLWIKSNTENAKCGNKAIHNGTVAYGGTRKLRCTPGTYTFSVRGGKEIPYDCNDLLRNGHDLCRLLADAEDVVIKPGQKGPLTFKFGTSVH